MSSPCGLLWPSSRFGWRSPRRECRSNLLQLQQVAAYSFSCWFVEPSHLQKLFVEALDGVELLSLGAQGGSKVVCFVFSIETWYVVFLVFQFLPVHHQSLRLSQLNNLTSLVRRLLITLAPVACWCVWSHLCVTVHPCFFVPRQRAPRGVHPQGQACWRKEEDSTTSHPTVRHGDTPRTSVSGETPALRPLGNQPGTPREPTRHQMATAHIWGNPNQAPSWRPTGDTPRAN